MPPGSRCKADARWAFKTYVALDLYRVPETSHVEAQHQEPEQYHLLVTLCHLLVADHLEDLYQALAPEPLHHALKIQFHHHWRRTCYHLLVRTLCQGESQEKTDHHKEMRYKHYHHRIRLKPPTQSSRCPTLWCHMGRILSRSRMRRRRPSLSRKDRVIHSSSSRTRGVVKKRRRHVFCYVPVR